MASRPLYLGLFAKLVLILGALSALLSFALARVVEASHEAFHLELEQKRFRPLAARLAAEWAKQGEEHDMRRLLAPLQQLGLASSALQVYRVGADGLIMDASVSVAQLRRPVIGVEPMREFVRGPVNWPLKGDDPRSEAGRVIFSAAPLGTSGQYLYVVLQGRTEGEAAPAAARLSYATRDTLWLMLGNVVAAFLAALAALWLITKPIARLRQAMDLFSRSGFEGPWQRLSGRRLLRDEIDQLGDIFDAMAARIAHQIESLRRADAARRNLFAGISHDLKTPLTAVQGYAERLARRKDLGEAERAKYAEIIRRQAAELASMVDELMEIAKLEAPEMRLSLAEVRVDQIASEVAGDLQPLSPQKRVNVQVEGKLPTVHADADLVRRALRNLVANALRETPEDQAVSIDVAALAGGAAVEIVVSDRGPGIAEEELEVIFRRFHRGSARQGEPGGSGLGLSIVRRIAELHAGYVSAANRPEGGAVFRLVLPRGGP